MNPKRLALATIAMLTLSTSAMAQRQAFNIDLNTLGATDASPIDDDGNPSTLAWILTLKLEQGESTAQRQLVVLRNGAPCFEAPFSVTGATKDTDISIVMEGKRSMLKVEPSNVATFTVGPNGQWVLSVPKYAPIELERRLCP